MKMSLVEKCEELISQNKWVEVTELIKTTTAQTIAKSQSSDLDSLNVAKYIQCEYLRNEQQSTFLLELLRFLRNSSTTIENQHFLSNNHCFLEQLKTIFQELMGQDNNDLFIKVILQFLVNLIVSNKESSLHVYKYCYDDILECFRKKKNRYEVLALLYNLHLQIPNLHFEESLYQNIVDEAYENNCEFAYFLAELFLYDICFWGFYKDFEISRKILILELLKDLWVERKLKDIPEVALQVLSESFSHSNNVIFQTITCNGESLEPYEVSLELEILGCFCGDEKYLRLLQKDKELLIRSGVVLINIHRLGKQSENYFSSIQKLSELKEPNEMIRRHPAFGFKVSLVRLIGNLCWKNKKMQDLVREAEIIPVLLDCCNIDARNPLIMQWVILAIKNLCENNLDNQAIIAGLHKEGTVSSALIEEMGLTLNNDKSGGIRIVPLDLKR